jgi:hypothetical protein
LERFLKNNWRGQCLLAGRLKKIVSAQNDHKMFNILINIHMQNFEKSRIIQESTEATKKIPLKTIEQTKNKILSSVHKTLNEISKNGKRFKSGFAIITTKKFTYDRATEIHGLFNDLEKQFCQNNLDLPISDAIDNLHCDLDDMQRDIIYYSKLLGVDERSIDLSKENAHDDLREKIIRKVKSFYNSIDNMLAVFETLRREE